MLSGGKSDLNKHVKSSKHERNWKRTLEASGWSRKLNCYLREHNTAMLAGDHAGPLFRAMFPGGAVAQVYVCARTKATALESYALAPETHDAVVECTQTQSFSLLVDETTDIL